MALSMKITSVLVQFFDENEKIVEADRMIAPSQDINEVIGNAFAYTPQYEINDEIDITLPDGMVSRVSVKAICRRGKKVYRYGDLWHRDDVLRVQPDSKRDALVGMLDKYGSDYIIAVPDSHGRHRIFPFFPDRDVHEILVSDIKISE